MAKHSDHTVIAQRYATALFELAEHDKLLDTISKELEVLASLIHESDDFGRLCNDPTLSTVQQHHAIATIMKKADPSVLLGRFMGVLAENGRLPVLPAIIREYQRLVHAKNDALVAEVVSASPMKKTQQTSLAKLLKEHFGKKVALEVHTDPKLISGLRIRVAGKLIDASIATKLQHLQTHLNAGIKQIV